MVGVLVNVATVILGGLVGLLLKKGLPEHVQKTVLAGLGLCTAFIGVKGAFSGENTLVMVLSIALGAIVGSLLDIDGALNRLGAWVEKKFKSKSASGSIAEGFVSATLLFCVGAMTVMGSINAGLRGDNEMLFTKSLLDMFAAMMLAASLGVGVALSALSILIVQGGIALLAGTLEPLLTATAVNEITCVGSIMVIAIGLNLIGATKIKVANLMPGILLAPLLSWLLSMVPILS
ncbi:MAG: DUF554 domain-containing protein [Oscillospiraceae bacterium]|nr:DUF554 domain-containing protein [Oscillospiraceae bacterium]